MIKQSHFDAQIFDRFIRLPSCCGDCALQTVIYWTLIFVSLIVLYTEWLLSLTVVQLLYYCIYQVMRSFSLLIFPVYFRYLKPQFRSFWRIRSFRRKTKYGMHRNKEDVVCIKTKLGGKVILPLNWLHI